MGAFSNMDYELQNSEAAVSDAFTEDDAMDMPQAAPVEPVTASSPTAAPTPAAAASEPATAPNTQSEDEARRAHEAAEAKRKAEWDAKQAEKRRAEQAALERLDAMGPAELLKAAAKRVSADTEKLTRRNMKESVAEFIQTKCIGDLGFARVSRRTAAIVPVISAISGRRTISVTPMPRRIRGMKRSLSRSPIVGKHLPSPFPRRKRKKRRKSRRRRNRRKKRKPTMGRSRWETSPLLGRQPDVRL